MNSYLAAQVVGLYRHKKTQNYATL